MPRYKLPKVTAVTLTFPNPITLTKKDLRLLVDLQERYLPRGFCNGGADIDGRIYFTEEPKPGVLSIHYRTITTDLEPIKQALRRAAKRQK